MDIAPIKTKRDYRQALKEIEGLMSAQDATRPKAIGSTCW